MHIHKTWFSGLLPHVFTARPILNEADRGKDWERALENWDFASPKRGQSFASSTWQGFRWNLPSWATITLWRFTNLNIAASNNAKAIFLRPYSVSILHIETY
jgi:hypothetical protein